MPNTHTMEILIVDDTPANLHILSVALEEAGYHVLVATSGQAALRSAQSNAPQLILLDIVMPEMDGYSVCRQLKEDGRTRNIPVIFLSARDEKESLLEGFRAGGIDYISKPFETEEVLIRVRTHLEIYRLSQELQHKNNELEQSNAQLREEMTARQRADARLETISQQEAERWGIEGFVGESENVQQLVEEVQQLQNTPSTSVLIRGESGTGKELIARALHFGSARKSSPFVPVNSSAISSELAESQLFGHVKGSFTGATSDHKGFFEQADGGTLFLDEIGDMPADLQVKLLRVLEEGTIRPIGATQEKKVDVRTVAATHVDLAQQIGSGAFRRDLYFRLAHFTIEVPPLRQRPQDIPLLADHFLEILAAEMGRAAPPLSPQALALLQAYAFPGNVREFKNMIEHALLKSRGGPIGAEHLHFLDLSAHAPAAPAIPTIIPQQPNEEDALITYVQTHGQITNSQCRQLLQVDSRRATYLLDKLCTAGVLVREGIKRHARYVLPALGG